MAVAKLLAMFAVEALTARICTVCRLARRSAQSPLAQSPDRAVFAGCVAWSRSLKVLALSVLSACSYGRVLTRDETPPPATDQAFICFAVDINWRTTVTLCRDAEMGQCFDFGPLNPNDPPSVAQVPVGRYCLIQVAAEEMNSAVGFVKGFEAERTSCFDVAPETIAYPGHFVYRIQWKPTPVTVVKIDKGWEKRDSVEAELRATYPKLAVWPIVTVSTRALQ